ncbi:hypothetical protein [Nostoc sp.]
MRHCSFSKGETIQNLLEFCCGRNSDRALPTIQAIAHFSEAILSKTC